MSYICIITSRLVYAENVISLSLAAEKSYESPDFFGSQLKEGFTPSMAVVGDLSTLLSQTLAWCYRVWLGNQEMWRTAAASTLTPLSLRDLLDTCRTQHEKHIYLNVCQMRNLASESWPPSTWYNKPYYPFK